MNRKLEKADNVSKRQMKLRSNTIRKVEIIVCSNKEKVLKVHRKQRTKVYIVESDDEVFELIKTLKIRFPEIKEYVIRYESGHGTGTGDG